MADTGTTGIEISHTTDTDIVIDLDTDIEISSVAITNTIDNIALVVVVVVVVVVVGIVTQVPQIVQVVLVQEQCPVQYVGQKMLLFGSIAGPDLILVCPELLGHPCLVVLAV